MRKIWNRAPSPVWSLSTRDENGKGNMNICTYVSSISMQPKMMMVAVYHHTKTLENLKRTPQALLQLLTADHTDIIHLLGRQSGTAIDKLVRLAKKHELDSYNQLSYMKDCAGYMELQIVEWREVGGDHLLGVAEVVSSKNLREAPILTTDYLKEKGIIR